MKPDCYKCKWRGGVSGSAHSSCNHPKVKKTKEDSALRLLSMLGRGAPVQMKTGLKVKGNNYGIRSGWFMHPFNFDPVWLEECDGFEEKNKKSK